MAANKLVFYAQSTGTVIAGRYVTANKTVKQDASMQLTTSRVVPYSTLKETSVHTSLMTAFESSSRFCVSCCNFISVQFMNLLSCQNTGLRLLN